MTTATAEATTPLKVDLYVCPTCFHVGKHPAHTYQAYCVGPLGQSHQKARMQVVEFKGEVPNA